MADSNKRFGEVLSDEVIPVEAFLERITQILPLHPKGCEGAVAGMLCLISIDPVC